jgi:hypothetical protein
VLINIRKLRLDLVFHGPRFLGETFTREREA